MVDSLQIAGFKVFRDLTLPKLARLNLFVGENNTGKSCLLEAVALYAGRDPISDVFQAATARFSQRLRDWDGEGVNEEDTSLPHPLTELFRREESQYCERLSIGTLANSSPFRMERTFVQLVRTDEGFSRYVLVTKGDAATVPTEPAIVLYRGLKQVGLVTRGRFRAPVSDRFRNEDGLRVTLLRARGLEDEKAASLWDSLVQGPTQDLVLRWLRMLEPGIEDLDYVGGSASGRAESRVALIKLAGKGRLPLRSMGDGLTRLFHIALAAATSVKGVLLIDEFESGLHWSVQAKLWAALARAATEFDIQVFCTTHSRDCLESFSEAVSQSGNGMIYRLERERDQIEAVELPLMNVVDALSEKVEVR